MADKLDFYAHPIINSPYEYPRRHWKLDKHGVPTGEVTEMRRPAEFVSPIPRAQHQRGGTAGAGDDDDLLGLFAADERGEDGQEYTTYTNINAIRHFVDEWRRLPKEKWGVTAETARLLEYWRTHNFAGIRPFFCQIEAVETLIWLTEVAPKKQEVAVTLGKIARANAEANSLLSRLALKLATGAGKTTVMAMVIAWQTVNAARYPNSEKFTRAFLVVAPGLTIKDRLRVLQPNDPESYFKTREIVPADMTALVAENAKIVITNYHAFKLRETMQLSAGGRALLQGRHGPEVNTTETAGQMLQRVAGELLGYKRVLVLNDEAHHCYREKATEKKENAAAGADNVSDSEDLVSEDFADNDSIENIESTENRAARPTAGAAADIAARNAAERAEALSSEERREVAKRNAMARLWISGIEALSKKTKLAGVIDLSATPFFLRGSGYIEGTLFPWTVSDFSLMDAIESGIVKLPRVPVADNDTNPNSPRFRNLWENIRKDMPRKSRATGGALDPQRLPSLLIAALDSLYDHYAKTFELWREAKLPVPPTFIIVCQNTAVSKLVYDYIAGYWVGRTNGGDADENAENDAGGGANTGIAGAGGRFRSGRFPLFHNFDENGNALARPNTLLIDSEQLEAGDALDKEFRSAAGDEIERFRRDIVERTGSVADAEKITDQQLLREVMNTVGKEGKLGGQIRCVVSVSMLTEGWDANTVTHILGVRAFRTQLLCEQVVGRALRRLSYELEDAEKKFFGVEYANILGIPFEFTKAPATNTKPVPPKPVTLVRAVVPERDELEIVFPRLEGYRIEPPDTTLTATFNDDSALLLTPEVVGPNQVLLAGIVGEKMQLTPEFLRSIRAATIVFHLTTHLLQKHFQDKNGEPELQFFGQAKRIVAEWVETKLRCAGGAFPAQVLYEQIADNACQLINDAITRSCVGTGSGSGSGTDKKRRERSEKHESDSPCFRAV